jgi:hypothetical protein
MFVLRDRSTLRVRRSGRAKRSSRSPSGAHTAARSVALRRDIRIGATRAEPAFAVADRQLPPDHRRAIGAHHPRTVAVTDVIAEVAYLLACRSRTRPNRELDR